MPSGYLVTNTSLGPRVRGLRAKYLGRDKLNSLLFAQTIDDVLNVLRGTDYGELLEKLGKDFREVELVSSIRSHVARLGRSMALSSPPRFSRVIFNYILKYEIDNIRVIARSLAQGMDKAESSINIGIQEALGRRDTVAYLLGSRDLEDLYSRLREMRHPAASSIEQYLRVSKQYPEYSLAMLDTLLDKGHLVNLTQQRDDSVSRFLRQLVEFYNINVILRGKLWGMPQDLVDLLTIKQGIVGSMVGRIYGDTVVRILDELSNSLPILGSLIKVAGTSELRVLVRYLGPFSYAYARDMEENILSLFTEFSPGAALASIHLKMIESEIVITIINSIIEGIPRENMTKLLAPIMLEP